MASCEMCGHLGAVEQGIVEGSVLFLCTRCMQYGDAVPMRKPDPRVVESRLTLQSRRRGFSARSVDSEMIVRGYAEVVKHARERTGKTQDEVAQAIAERSSVVQRVESGNLEPPLKLARKLEQYFKITLVKGAPRQVKEEVKEFTVKSDGLTIGDLLKMKDPKDS